MSNPEFGTYNRARKRKKSLMRQSKKHGKRGNFGMGSRIDEDKFQYFIRVMEMNKSENFQSDEERGLFANNALEETEGMEIVYSCNQLASRVIENLLDLANSTALSRYLRAFGEDLRPIFCDKFASHVLEKLIIIASTKKPSEEENVSVGSETDLSEWLLKVAMYALNNLEQFVGDTYANQVVRLLLECLAGLPPHSTRNSKGKLSSVEVEKRREDLLVEFGHKVLSWPHLPDLVFTDITAAFLQTLLQALSVRTKKLANSFVRKLLDECFALPESTEDTKEVEDVKDLAWNTSQLLPIFNSVPASRVLEAAIMVTSNKLRTQIYARCFINKMLLLSTLPGPNFCVQRLLSYHKVKEEFEAMYEELGPHMGKLLASGNTGVMMSLGQACLRLATKQGNFVTHLMEALNIKNERDILPLVLKLTNTNKSDDSPKIHLHGSILVQTMLQFNKPIKVVNSLLAMEPTVLRDVLSDPCGCHITDVFMSSEHVGEKRREKLVAVLKGQFVKLACSKHGSRSVEAIWEAANLQMKSRIAKELAENETVLESNQYGFIIFKKFALELFRHQQNDWKEAQTKQSNKKKLFADIINDKLS